MDNKNEKNEDLIETREISAPEEVKDETTPTAASVPMAQPDVCGKAAGWGEKNVTRKFLSIALALALALNIALTAGVVKLLGHNKGFDKRSLGRPGNEQRFDNNRGGRGNMMPPSGNQPPAGQQNQQPDGQQNQQSDDQQNGSQQSDDQKNDDQETA